MLRDKEDTPPEIVIFRKWRDGDIIAIFPEIPADNSGNLCQSYEHVGQHGGADYWVVLRQTTPATAEEAEDLARELESIGYKLEARQRATATMHNKRHQEATL